MTQPALKLKLQLVNKLVVGKTKHPEIHQLLGLNKYANQPNASRKNVRILFTEKLSFDGYKICKDDRSTTGFVKLMLKGKHCELTIKQLRLFVIHRHVI